MARKAKASEENPRTRLSGDFLRALADDFNQFGPEIIAKMRESHPERYAELCGKLIQTVEPKDDGLKGCTTLRDIGRRVLVSYCNIPEDTISEEMVDSACAAHQVFMASLEEIAGTKDRKDLN